MMNILKYILNNLDVSVALFDSNAQLVTFNNNLLDLWHINQDFLLSNPNIVEFFEVIREKGVIPEFDNFREFCEEISNTARSSGSYIKVKTILLPSGKNIEETINKSEDGLLFIWRDISDVSDIARNLSTYKNLYNRLVEKNPKPLTIIGSNGLIEGYNTKFLEKFNLDRDSIGDHNHARELLSKMAILENRDQDRAILLGNLVSSRSFNLSIKLTEDSNLHINGIYLQNSSTFVQWDLQNNDSKVTVEINTESVANLHNSLILDLNTVISTPVSNIIGFADLLQNEYVGNLNLRQKEYMEKILQMAEFINFELNNKIELTEIENTNSSLDIEDVDINVVIAYTLNQLKPRLKKKNIAIKLDIPTKLHTIKSNEVLLNKSFCLLLMYIIEQNNYNSEIKILVEQINTNTLFTIKDNAKATLLSQSDMIKRYDLNLALKILKKLNFNYEYASKNRSERFITIKNY